MLLIAFNIVLLALMSIGAIMTSVVAAIPVSNPNSLSRLFTIGAISIGQIILMTSMGIAAAFWNFPSFLFPEGYWSEHTRYSLLHLTTAGTLGAMLAFITVSIAGVLALMAYSCIYENVKNFRSTAHKIRTRQIRITPRAIAHEIFTEWFVFAMFAFIVVTAFAGALFLKDGTEAWHTAVGAISSVVSVAILALTILTMILGLGKSKVPCPTLQIGSNETYHLGRFN